MASESCLVAGNYAGDFGLSRLGYPLIEFITEDLMRTEGRHPICRSAKQATLPELFPFGVLFSSGAARTNGPEYAAEE